ncbi:methyltransferase-like protein 13 [Coffea eugenioides]|uniref:methyltransferase-like protein 13 n=1 Tax=Coffea eugenioides TaxID=49369 RepID=UPI000F60FC2D|nr:methyltransferase-like protein 13 [Coffea eugenioides]
MSVLDPTTFQTIVPSRYITFTFPNPLFLPALPHCSHLLHTSLLRIAVLDSPSPISTTPRVAAMLAPPRREQDWTFSTETGHLQLLLSFPYLSRLILISNNDINNPSHPTSYKAPPLSTTTENPSTTTTIEENLLPLLLALTPKSAFDRSNGFPEIPFLSYEDEVISSLVLEICVGPFVGEMLIENVVLESESNKNDKGREFRRRLRFKRMPNLIQTQVRIHPISELGVVGDELEGVEFTVDDGALVQPYLNPMVAGLAVISSYLDEQIRCGIRPRALCLGVGGGALLRFLSDQLGFEVVGVEEDEVVLSVAKRYFGLRHSESVHLCVGDGMELMQRLALKGQGDVDSKFAVVMVDLDSSDARMGTSAPPLNFVRKSVLLVAKEIICQRGVLIINVIPASKSFYERVVTEFQEVFEELYEIDVGNGENMVLAALRLSKIRTASGDFENSFHQKLEASIQGSYMNSVRKI